MWIFGRDWRWFFFSKTCHSTARKKIKFGDILVVEKGNQADSYNEKDVKEYMKWGSIVVEVDLGMGSASHTVYTCDFTKEYVDINADYRN